MATEDIALHNSVAQADGTLAGSVPYAKSDGQLQHDNASFRVDDTNKVFNLANLGLLERSADPPDPADGQAVIWMGDGTGTGDDGDILMKVTAATVTKTVTIFDYSTGTIP